MPRSAHRMLYLLMLLLFALPGTAAAQAADVDANRIAMRDRLERLLTSYGSTVNIEFHRSEKNPFNIFGFLRTGLSNSSEMEVVLGITAKSTINVRVFPKYNGNYVNLDKARNSGELARQMLHMTNANFMFWGVDDGGDLFAGFTFTLESGFPDEAMKIVLRSIRNLDEYVGQMRPNIDGTAGVKITPN
jgi:hypothetical protein